MAYSEKTRQFDLVSTWDAVSKDYNKESYWSDPANYVNLEMLLKNCHPNKQDKIVEMGCGSGYTSLAMAERGAIVTLLDVSPIALQVAIQAFEKTGLPSPICYRENAMNSTLPANTYNMVWNGGVLEHATDRGKILFIREMVRICAPSGKVVIIVPNKLCLPFQLIQSFQKVSGTWEYGFEDDMSPRRLWKLCNQAGFPSAECFSYNPIAGWKWIPYLSSLIKLLGFDKIKWHRKKTRFGFLAIAVITKNQEMDVR